MVQRTATVLVTAPHGPYVASMGKMAAASTGMARTTQSAMAQANASMIKLGQATGALPAKFGALSGALGGVGTGLSVVGAGVAGVALGAAFAVKKFADFDVAMDAVAASTGATGAELKQLGDTALSAAADTKFGATEAAAGIESLAKAGIRTSDIVGGALKGSLDLAAAGEIEVAEAAELAAGAMTQFGLSGSEVPHVADLMAAAAGKAQGSVGDMGMAFKQSGLVASQMGLSIEETTGTLAAFASNALIGSDAGTAFRTMLLRMANPTGKAAALMEDLGIAAYDAGGNFVGMEGLAGQLQQKLGGLSEAERNAALATIFGNDAIRAANVLYKEGAGGISNWTANVNDSGFAAEQAAARTDNLAGDLERLGGAVESLGIKAGGTADGPLRDFVQGLEGIAHEISNEIDLWKEFDRGMDEAKEKMEGLTGAQVRFGGAVGVTTEATQKSADAMDAAERRASLLKAEMTGTATSVEGYAGAAETAGIQTGLLAEEMAAARQEAIDTANAFLGSRDAQREFEQAVDDAAQAVKDNGETLDINSQKGRDNEAQLDRVASAALGVMESVEFVTASEKRQNRMSENMREELIRAGRRFGLTKAQANAYADEILGIPKAAKTKASFEDAAARAKLRSWKNMLEGIPGSVKTSINAFFSTSGQPGGGPQSAFDTSGSGRLFPAPGGRSAYRVTQGLHPVNAIDYGMPTGTPLYASFSGYLQTADAGNRSYGKHYRLSSGSSWIRGAHLSRFARSSGFVSRGTLVGWSGSTGNSTGPHLHLENFHRGGWTPGGPINSHRGEFVVNAAASAQNAALLQAINSGRVGNDGGAAARMHPADITAIGNVIARQIVAAVGAGAYSAGRQSEYYSRGG